MATVEMVAFKWAGAFDEAAFDVAHKAVFLNLGGEGIVTIDGEEPLQIWGETHPIEVSFTDASGNPHRETFTLFDVEGEWYVAPREGSAFGVGATLRAEQRQVEGWDYATADCFADGTLIETAKGPVAVENLVPGDLVLALSGDYRPLRLNLAREMTPKQLQADPKLRPVRIMAGALGDGLPARDLWVSRQQRMLVSSPIAKRMFGTREVLLAAEHLTDLPGCFVDMRRDRITYHHLVFKAHEIIFTNGTPSESSLREAADEALLPPAEEHAGESCVLGQGSASGLDRKVPVGRRQRKLVSRHLAQGKPMILDRGSMISRPLKFAPAFA